MLRCRHCITANRQHYLLESPLAPEELEPPVPAEPADPGDPDVPDEPDPMLELPPELPLPPEDCSPAPRLQPTTDRLSAATINNAFDALIKGFMCIPFIQS